MAILAWRLERAGHASHLFGYQVVTDDLESIADRLVERVVEVLEEDAQERTASTDDASALPEPVPYAIIGHSLGNVITRLASPSLAPGWARFILLAPPNRPSTLALGLRHNRLFRMLTGDTGRRLADPAFFDHLPVPDVPSLVIAGTAGPRAAWLPLGDTPNDGIVTAAETRLAGVPHIEVPALHTFLMNRKDVLDAILAFLDTGQAPAPARS